MSHLVKYTGAAIADLFSALGFPGGSTLQAALDGYQQRRNEDAKEILLSELRSDAKADWQVANEDALFGAIHRFRRAAIEGAARHNLRLIARTMRGTLLSGEITADRFNLFSDMLASLSRAECRLLGRTHLRCRIARDAHGSTSSGVGVQVFWDSLVAELVPHAYPSARHLTTALMALQRTGLVISVGSVDHINVAYETSPLMDDLDQIIAAEDLCVVGLE